MPNLKMHTGKVKWLTNTISRLARMTLAYYGPKRTGSTVGGDDPMEHDTVTRRSGMTSRSSTTSVGVRGEEPALSVMA